MSGAMLAVVSLFGGLCGLDRTAFGQTLLAHPMIAAALAGALVGDAGAGLWAGFTLTALSARVLPVGERSIRDWTSAAVVLGAVAGSVEDGAVRGSALLLAPWIAWLGGRWIHRVRGLAARVLAARRARPASQVLEGLEFEHLRLTSLHGIRGALLVGCCTWLATAFLPPLVERLGAPERAALDGLWKVAPLAALPLLLRFHVEPGRLWPYVALGALAGLVISWWGGGIPFFAFRSVNP